MFALLFRNEINSLNLDPDRVFSVLLTGDELKWGVPMRTDVGEVDARYK